MDELVFAMMAMAPAAETIVPAAKAIWSFVGQLFQNKDVATTYNINLVGDNNTYVFNTGSADMIAPVITSTDNEQSVPPADKPKRKSAKRQRSASAKKSCRK